MSGNVVAFDAGPSPDAIRAWKMFDDAQREATALYNDPQSTRQQRLDAMMRAARLHKAFMRTMGAL